MAGSSAKNQFLGVGCHLLVAIGFGAGYGWTSPSMPILLSEKSPLTGGPLTDAEASWIASIISIGCIAGIVAYGWAIEQFGRRWPGIFMGLPVTVS